jgi:hypothetical protein
MFPAAGFYANARDAELRLTARTAGNGVVTTQNFDMLTDRLTPGAVYQNFLYDTEHARIWRAAPEGGTLYFDAFGMHVEWLNNGTWYD